MKNIFKIIGVLVLLVLLAVVALVFTFDANNYKAEIVAQVEQQTGREFKIDGDINPSLYPWVGLKVEKVMMGNAQGFSERTFAEIAQLDVKVMLLPLLKQEFHVDKVRLHGLSVSLEIDDQGRSNWSDLSQPAAKDAATTTSAQPATGSAALAGLAVNGIELVDANIRWLDEQSNMQATVSEMNLETGAIKFNEPVDIKFGAHLISSQPEADAKITLQTKVKFNEALNVFDANDIDLNIQTMMQSVSKQMIALSFKANAHADLKFQTASLKSVEVSALGAIVRANLDVTHLDTEPKIKGTISTNDINGRAVASQLQIELPPMADANSLTHVSFMSDIDASPSSINLDKFTIGLDQSQITGWVHVLDVALPNVKYNLKMSPIKLDGYMAPPSKEVQPETAVAAIAVAPEVGVYGAEAGVETAGADVEIPLPIDLLRTLGLAGLFKIDSVTFQDIEVTDINIKTQAGSGLIRIKPITMNTLRGRIDASIDLDVRQTPEYTLAVNASDLQAGPVVNPLLKGLMGDEEIEIKGAVQLTADIKTKGNSLLVLKKAALGTVNFDMDQTSITGMDIEYFARNAVVDYLEEKKLDVSPEWRGEYAPKQTTAFRKIHATAVVAQGKVTNDDFIMDSRRIKVTGKGEVDIIKNVMDYNSVIDLTLDRKQTFAEKVLDEPMGVHIHGPFEQLAIEPDTKRIAKAAQNLMTEKAKAEASKKIEAEKKKLKEKSEQEKEEAKKKLDDKLKDKLKGLF